MLFRENLRLQGLFVAFYNQASKILINSPPQQFPREWLVNAKRAADFNLQPESGLELNE